VLEGLTEEARDLRGEGAPWWDEEGRRVLDAPAVPADLTGLLREQSEQGLQQRRLARADPTGDDNEAAAPDLEADPLDPAAGVGIAVGQAARVEHGQAIGGGPLGPGKLGRLALDVDRTVRHEVLRRRAPQQRRHAGERDAELAVVREQTSR